MGYTVNRNRHDEGARTEPGHSADLLHLAVTAIVALIERACTAGHALITALRSDNHDLSLRYIHECDGLRKARC